jgi:GntR family transcriptional repressor for pyruvate dehydrogenase complex
MAQPQFPEENQPLERESLVDRLTSRLQESILSGRYDRGATLPPERDLAKSLQVNRTSLKHALQRLEQLGFIATRHGIGSIVLDPTETAGSRLLSYLLFRASGIDVGVLADMIEARTLLGAFLARLAAGRRTKEDLAAIDRTLEELALTSEAEEVQRLELKFFRCVLRATKNQIFVTLANSMFAIYHGRAHMFRDAFSDGAALHRSLSEIARAIHEKDGAEAERVTLEYLKQNGNDLVRAAARVEK